jgi:AcrR family transcriptional regulator
VEEFHDDLAKKLGMMKASIYYHFAKKVESLAAFLLSTTKGTLQYRRATGGVLFSNVLNQQKDMIKFN